MQKTWPAVFHHEVCLEEGGPQLLAEFLETSVLVDRRRIENGGLGSRLQTGVPGSLRNIANLYGSERAWRSWGDLLYSVRTTTKDESGRAYTALLLVLEVGMVGTFVAQDLLLFFIFFEIVLIPMYGLILRWGTGTMLATVLVATVFLLVAMLGRTFGLRRIFGGARAA